MMKFATGVAAFSLWLGHAAAIHVAKGSPCESLCGNVLDATTEDDVVCKEEDYADSTAGRVYQQCLSCELTSDFVTQTQTDTQWLLYNLRYAVSYCVFGFPDNPNVGSSPCLTRTACEPLQKAITYNELAPNGTEYDYCTDWDHNQISSCAACLRAGDRHYLTNFITVLDAGCQQKPSAGQTVSIEGSPFSKTRVNVTDPTPTNTYVPNYDNGTINLGAKVGIAIGSLLLVLGVAGFCIVWNGKRRRRAFLKRLEMKQKGPSTGWPSPLNMAGLNDTPLSQRPLRSWDDTPNSSRPTRGWDESPLSPQGEKAFPRYFSPYSSQYNSPVSGTEAQNMQWPITDVSQRSQPQEIGLALGGDDAEQGWQESNKGKGRTESYELREVDGEWDARQRHPSPPVLQHPAHTMYAQHNPAAYHGVTEEDVRRGYI